MTSRQRAARDAGKRAAAIAELSVELAEPRTTTLLEDLVVQRVCELVGDVAALWRHDDEGHLELVASRHVDEQAQLYLDRVAPFASHSDTEGVLPHVWRTATSVRLGGDDLRRLLPGMQPAYRAYAETFGMVSLLIVPLRVRGRVVALLGVSRDSLPELDDDDERFVAQIGAVIAVALDNERLLRQARASLSEQNRAHLAAHRAAVHDALTGLPNRRLLLERLHGLIARDDQDLALLIVDLDNFKLLNDAHGHAAGDAALVEVTRRLQAVVAAAQLGSRTTLARLGGDEFAVLVAVPPGSAPPLHLPGQILASLSAALTSVEGGARVGASIGLALASGGSGSTLMRHADIAMYRAKRTRSGWAQYEAEQDVAAEVRLRELHELDVALTGRQLHLAHQPIVPRGPVPPDGRHFVEALVRWQHPERGALLPGDFLPLVQQSGRMPLLTAEVVRLALADLVAWREQGLAVQVSINVGADVLADRTFLPTLLDGLGRAGLPPASLCLELTESEVLGPQGPSLLAQVRAAGLSVALDDFGTGYSSLSYLADLPLDRLKLDRSFVRRLDEDRRMAQFVGGLVSLVHGLDLPVIAEGVESASAAARLDALDVAYQQGFRHSRPLPASRLPSFWARG